MPEPNRSWPPPRSDGARPDGDVRGTQGHGPGTGGGGGGRTPSGGRGGTAPRVAAPWYVGTRFDEAPPGHRYLLYLPFWAGGWSAIKEGKQKILKQLGVFPDHARVTMHALAERQRTSGAATGAEVIEAVSIAPFATGLGWEHPNENGFAFLHPYGLPYLAGSGVKGVLRDAARELADGHDGDTHGWTKEAIDKLFGPMPEEITKSEDAFRGALRFFDVIPEIAADKEKKIRMDVDIMNPHYGDYYQGKSAPHDAGSPVPIFFLIVPPDSKFTFVVDCPRERLLPEELRAKWRSMVRAAFKHAFRWLGFGAKTAVGYGAMRLATDAGPKSSGTGTGGQSGRSATEPAAESAPEETWPAAKLVWKPGSGELTASFLGKATMPLRGEKAQKLIEALGQRANRLKRDKELANVAVTVRAVGGRFELHGLA